MQFHVRTLIAQFTIRDLFWLTVVIGLGTALIVERRSRQRATDRANRVLEMLEKVADFAAWEEGWEIKTTESTLEIHRPLPIWRPPADDSTFSRWAKRVGDESLVRDFSRDSIRKRNGPVGRGLLPEERWKGWRPNQGTTQAASSRSPPPIEAELEQIKARSAELGVPQPKPLPASYGEKPN
jgi:hypothetical protein